MSALLFFKSLFIICLWSSIASASLIERDYLGVTGGITYDSETNFEWLDLTFTRNMRLSEYQNYLSDLNASWMFASSILVSDLLTNFDFTSAVNADYGTANVTSELVSYNSPEVAFIDLVDDLTILGESMSQGSSLYGVKGFTSDKLGTAHEQFMAYYNGSQSLGITSLGGYNRVPTGKPIQSFFTYREAVAFQPVAIISQAVTLPAISVPEPATLGLFSLFLCLMGLRNFKN